MAQVFDTSPTYRFGQRVRVIDGAHAGTVGTYCGPVISPDLRLSEVWHWIRFDTGPLLRFMATEFEDAALPPLAGEG